METKYCDVGNPRIQRLAQELARGLHDDKMRAVVIFRWVQDSVHYRILHDWTKKASETLVAGGGSCTNKANLYVALMRALDIPAGYHVMRVRGNRYFGPMWLPMLQRLCDDTSVHLHAAVYLDDRWVKCDPSADWVLSDGTSHINPPSERVVFDGERDAVLNIDPAHVLDVSECLPSIDSVIAKRTRKPAVYFDVMNLFLDYGRQSGRAYAPSELIEPMFREWLACNHPRTYATFLEAEAALLADREPMRAPRAEFLMSAAL